MRKSRITAIAVTAVATIFAAAAATSASTPAGTSGSASPLQQKQVNPYQVQVVHQKLVDNANVHGYSGTALSAGGFTPIDSGEQITCKAGGCTIEGNLTVQALGTGSSNGWAICLYIVDLGSYASCPYIDYLSSSYYETRTVDASIASLPAGTHTVQTRVYSMTGGTAYNYSLTYHSYRP